MSDQLIGFFQSEPFVLAGLSIAAGLGLMQLLRGGAGGGARTLSGAPASRRAHPSGLNRLVGLTIFGFLAVGWSTYVAIRFGVLWSIPLFGIGLGTTITCSHLGKRQRAAHPVFLRVEQFASSGSTAAMLLGVLVIANLMVFRYGGRTIDFTRDRSLSLESMTVNTLKGLKKPVTLTLFAGGASGQFERVSDLLDRFQAENPEMIEVSVLDPYRDPSGYQRLIDRVPGLRVTSGGGVLVSTETEETLRYQVVRNLDMFEASTELPPPGSDVVGVTEFYGESALTSALLRVTTGGQTTIAVTAGHGEPSIDEANPRLRGLGQLRLQLESLGLRVVSWNPGTELPMEASMALVADPELPFGTEAANRLRAFVDRGGRVVFAIGNQRPTGLEDWLLDLGIQFKPGLVVDPDRNLNGAPVTLVATIERGVVDHPVVNQLNNRNLVLPMASEIAPADSDEPKRRQQRITGLVKSSRSSWREQDLESATVQFDRELDEAGPADLVIGIEKQIQGPGNSRESEPIGVVIGSPNAVDNRMLSLQGFANRDLILNAISWLEDRPELAGIEPRTYVVRRLTASEDLRAKLVLLPTVMAIVVLLALGMTMAITRRQ